jgi:hypothetical protein
VIGRPKGARIESVVRANTRVFGSLIALVLLLDVLVAVRHGFSPALVEGRKLTNQSAFTGEAPGGSNAGSLPNGASSVVPTSGPSGASSLLPGGSGKTLVGKPGTFIPGEGTIPFGVTKDSIYIVYYWKGDRTTTSPFLGPTGQKGAVDEADAFRHFVDYVNKHANGDATFMGFPFNLHGRKIVYDIYDAGQYPETYGSTAQSIIDKPPLVAISSHGGLSDYVCDYLFKARIFNMSTYDLGRYAGGLYRGSNGYCLPQGLAWEGQVDLSVSYLAKQNRTTTYQSATEPGPRVYGILYADYPGLRGAVAKLKTRLGAAGVAVAGEYRLPTSLTDAGRDASNAVAYFKGKHVNTLIAPDAGAPITFTHAAQANGYAPDYYVWPCSGEDAVGQVRLYDPAQWARAEGLSCYDANWNLDLTLDDNARQTEWYHQYQEMAGSNSDPPSSSPLVYQAMLPLLAGITNGGRDLTVERFRAGMMAFRYPRGLTRYDAIRGPTAAASHFMVALGSPDGSQIGDVAHVRWDNTEHTSGNTSTGNYLYLDGRYRPGFVF